MITENFVQLLSVQLHSILQIYLEGDSHGRVGHLINFNKLPSTKIEKMIHETRLFLFQTGWERNFSIHWNSASIENIISELFSGLENLINVLQCDVNQKRLLPKKFQSISKRRFYGIGYDINLLHDIIDFLADHRHLYHIAVIDGSIGSVDYKPGWSDIDIFIVLESEIIHSPKALKEARKFARKLKQKVYNYCILQLHGIFYSTVYNFLFHVDQLFPIECFKNGMNISKNTVITVNIPKIDYYALNYFECHIYHSAKQMIPIVKKLGFFKKILLIHRVFAFPFAFLATQGLLSYKRDSFNTIVEHFSQLFPDIQLFYFHVNRFYHEWKINEIMTIRLRRSFSVIFNMKLLNKILYNFEPEIIHRIDFFYDHFMTRAEWDRFEKYLQTSKQFIMTTMK